MGYGSVCFDAFEYQLFWQKLLGETLRVDVLLATFLNIFEWLTLSRLLVSLYMYNLMLAIQIHKLFYPIMNEYGPQMCPRRDWNDNITSK